MRATPGVGCHLDAEGGVVGLFIGVLHNVAGQDLAADIVVVQQVRQTLAVGGLHLRTDGESVHRGSDWTDVYGRGDHR